MVLLGEGQEGLVGDPPFIQVNSFSTRLWQMRYISSCAYIINNSLYLLEEFESSRALVIQCLKGLKISFLNNYKANMHVTHINGNLSAAAEIYSLILPSLASSRQIFWKIKTNKSTR